MIKTGTMTCIGILFLLFALCPAAVSAQRLSVGSPVANIRGGPGTGYDILWKVQKYFPLSVLKRSGSWIYFEDFEGDRGWIHKSLTQKTPSVITTKERNNIRSGPGTKFDIRFTVEAGIPFKVIGKKGAWIRIEHADGDRGWIHRSLVW
jgi:SH3-like domain-containing protein